MNKLIQNITLFIAVLLMICMLFSCNYINKRDCKCKLKNIPNESIDTFNHKEIIDPINLDIEGKLSGKIKRFIDAELSLKVNPQWKNIKIENIVKSFDNTDLENIQVLTHFRFKRLLYCEFYERMCDDENLTDEELNILSNKKIDEIEKMIDSYFSNKVINPDETTIEKINEAVRFSLTPFNSELSDYLKLEYNLLHDPNSTVNKISIKTTGKMGKVSEDSNLFMYSGGNLLLEINGNTCANLNELKIERTHPSGNPIHLLEEKILDNQETLINKEFTEIAKQIIGCL